MKQYTVAGSHASPIPFFPDFGAETRRLSEISSSIDRGDLIETLSRLAQSSVGEAPQGDAAKVRFAASLLLDVVNAGGYAWTRDSQVFVAWPDWRGPDGKLAAERALTAVRDVRPLEANEIERIRPALAPELDGDALAEVLSEARFRLLPASVQHPSGVSYQEVFGAALRYWTMPYRGRAGRMRRFVLTAEHALLGPAPVVAGILELGDEAPFCTWRDELLGLSPLAFTQWLERNGACGLARSVQERMREIRGALRATSDGLDLASADTREIYADRRALEAMASGRSRARTGNSDLLKDQKRVAYGLRLARGEVAMQRIAAGETPRSYDSDLVAGVRAVHDVLVPRVHMEVTVCGALPPFSSGLGGKLVVAFLSHPDVVASTIGAGGDLLGWSFDPARLAPLVPDHGLLAITTKGLYSEHAAIYNRTEVPGSVGPLRLRHLANTGGTTTTLISQRTVRLARQVLADPDRHETSAISEVHGSGGAKRHRIIHNATVTVGLPPRLPLAGIRRPVYGVKLVTNAEEVCWLNEEPHWKIDRHVYGDEFSDRAATLWRERWLQRASVRAQDFAIAPNLVRLLESAKNSR